jgi:hypothetical protein
MGILRRACCVLLMIVSGCDDGEPSKVLIRTDPADATVCAHGGSVVRAGRDLDDDGTLDDSEILTAMPICAAGPAPAPPVLVRTDDEPKGMRCPMGGVIVVAGRDLDGDGALDDAEVERTDVQCSDVTVGQTVVILSADDLAAYAKVRVIDGDLYISASGVEKIVLPALTSVRGSVQITGTRDLLQVVLPALRTVGGGVIVMDNRQLVHVGLPVLHDTGDGLRIASNESLELFETPKLYDVGYGTQIWVVGNRSLSRLALPVDGLFDGTLDVEDNAALIELDIESGHLERAEVLRNPALETLRLDVGTTVAQVPRVDVRDNARLADVALTCGRCIDVTIDAPAMRELALAVAEVGALRITGPISKLPSLDVGTLALTGTRLRSLALDDVGSLYLVDNDELTKVRAHRVRNDLIASDNAALTSLEVDVNRDDDGRPGLRGLLSLDGNPVLAKAPWLADLRRMRSLIVRGNPQLRLPASLDLALDEGTLIIEGAPGLTRLDAVGVDLHELSVVGTELVHLRAASRGVRILRSSVRIRGNAKLEDVQLSSDFSDLTAFEVDDNPALRALDAALTVGDVDLMRITGNPALPACKAQALLDQFEADSELQEGNDDGASCAP